jgi:hypothetical protein
VNDYRLRVWWWIERGDAKATLTLACELRWPWQRWPVKTGALSDRKHLGKSKKATGKCTVTNGNFVMRGRTHCLFSAGFQARARPRLPTGDQGCLKEWREGSQRRENSTEPFSIGHKFKGEKQSFDSVGHKKKLTGPYRARHAPGGSGGTAWKKKKGMEWRN